MRTSFSARNPFHFVLQPQRDLIIRFQIQARNLRVDRRRQAEVQNLADDVGRLKINLHAGKLLMHQASNLVAVRGGRMMVGFERNQDIGVLRPDTVGLIIRQHVGERGQADIVADAIEFAGRNHPFDATLDAIDEALGLLDPGAAGRAQMHFQHAGIDRREKIFTHHRSENQRRSDQNRHAGKAECAPRDERAEQIAIAVPKAIEPAIEAADKARP